MEAYDQWWEKTKPALIAKLPIYLQTDQFGNKGLGLSGVLAYILGVCLPLGLWIWWAGSSYAVLGLYIASLSVYHQLEFMSTAMFNPTTLSNDSFLLNHSTEFALAMAISFVEFWVEWFFFPGLKNMWWLTYIALPVVIVGQVFRTLAMWTARHAFTHQISTEKRKEHGLVNWGVYAYVRHPGYFGWYWWTVFTQIMVGNPICALGFGVVAWSFFKDRIEYEENKLIEFFGDEYKEFRAKTPTYIPLIK